MKRTYGIAKAASGIGATTADWLAEGGAREILRNLHHADVLGGVVADTGIGNPNSSTIRVNCGG